MKSKFNYYWLLIFALLIFISWYFISLNTSEPTRRLAYFGPKNAVKVNDTSYHVIPAFEFTNQFNEKVSQEQTNGKIYVTEYFFTTCKSICPIMNENMERVYQAFHDKNDFLILSHTVDPETDSVSVLKAYADLHQVTDKKWMFLTGTKKDLYGLARQGYLLDAEEGDGGEEDFIHTQNFALVDKDKHIRGYYDGTDSLEVNRLIQEINLLYQEYEHKK